MEGWIYKAEGREPHEEVCKTEWLKIALYLLMVGVMLYVVVYMPTPYLVYQPGSAEEVRPMINVEKGDPAEEGTL